MANWNCVIMYCIILLEDKKFSPQAAALQLQSIQSKEKIDIKTFKNKVLIWVILNYTGIPDDQSHKKHVFVPFYMYPLAF